MFNFVHNYMVTLNVSDNERGNILVLYSCKITFFNMKISTFLIPELSQEEYQHFTYTGCPRRKGQNFGSVFLMLNYTDITQNTYIQV